METKTYRMVILSDQTFLYSRGLFVHFQIWNNLDFEKFKILLNQHFVQLERLIFRQFQSSNRVIADLSLIESAILNSFCLNCSKI